MDNRDFLLIKTKKLAEELYNKKLETKKLAEEHQKLSNVRRSLLFNQLTNILQPFNNEITVSKHPIQIRANALNYHIRLSTATDPQLVSLTVVDQNNVALISVTLSGQVEPTPVNYEDCCNLICNHLAPMLQLPKNIL